MKNPLLLPASCLLGILLLSSCVDPNYYGGSYGVYGSASYTTLPYGYRTVYVSGVPYYYYGSRWYRHHGGRYVSCARPHGYHGSIGRIHHHGHTISRLPYGYRTVVIGGHRYYHHGSNWYRKSGSHYSRCARPSGYKSSGSHHPHHHGRSHSKPDYHHRKSSSYFERFKKVAGHPPSQSHHASSDLKSHSREDSHRSHKSRSSSGSKTYVKSHSGDRSRHRSISTGGTSSAHAYQRSKSSASGSGSTAAHSGRTKASRGHSPQSGDKEESKSRISRRR